MDKNVSIYWIRQDLRLYDNPALKAAVNNGAIVPIYILDDINSGEHKLGGASRIWLHHSLEKLNKQFKNKLYFFNADPLKIISEICETEKIYKVYWNRVMNLGVFKGIKKLKKS